MNNKFQRLIDLVKAVNHYENHSSEILHLTANENIMSSLARGFLSSRLSYRYHLGTHNDYHLQEIVNKSGLIFKGMPAVYQLEQEARRVSLNNFSAIDCDFRYLSGVHGLIATVALTTKPGDVIYSISPEDGGHFATQGIVTALGRKSVLMNFDQKTLNIDIDNLSCLTKEITPDVIILDHGATMFEFPLKKIRDIVGNEPLLIFDASHTFGLIYGHQFKNPLLCGWDILQGNTHKTFPGPQKAMLFFGNKNPDLSHSVINGISNSMVSSQHTHHAIALYITLLEMHFFGAKYAEQTVQNAKTLANELEKYGFNILQNKQNHTDTNIVFIKNDSKKLTEARCRKLHSSGISTNARRIYGAELLRLGVQEITRKGMSTNEIKFIARLIKHAILDEKNCKVIQEQIKELLNSFDNIHYSFDSIVASHNTSIFFEKM